MPEVPKLFMRITYLGVFTDFPWLVAVFFVCWYIFCFRDGKSKEESWFQCCESDRNL